MARADMLASEHGDLGDIGGGADALFELGLMYATGRDVATDLVQAHKWFNLSALKGNAAAKAYRTEIAAELSKDDIAEAQRQARQFLTQH